jgi:hypothetical protein
MITGQLLRIDQIDLPPEYERKASLVEDDNEIPVSH